MLEDKILQELTLEDLQEIHRQIAEEVGINGLIRLSNRFGGTSLYVPQKRELVKNRTYARILEEYDGTNIKQLAIGYGVSESTVYNVVKEKIVKGSAKKQLPGQYHFADIGLI